MKHALKWSNDRNPTTKLDSRAKPKGDSGIEVENLK